MNGELSKQDLARIQSGIREKYTAVAKSPGAHFTYPTGKDGLTGLNYDRQLLALLPDKVAAAYCGVGNPFALGEIKGGERVLDIGCGAGTDTLLAAELVGGSGHVLGIDVTPEMIHAAKANQARMKATNVEFKEAAVEDLSGMQDFFDVVISNGVFNLLADKSAAVKAVFHILKPGGRLWMADQFLARPTLKSMEERVASWSR
jgi:2-polyprenyl-3-methyl-5-hydroxy-6-metoxy-1,4-benzoquinol methylase